MRCVRNACHFALFHFRYPGHRIETCDTTQTLPSRLPIALRMVTTTGLRTQKAPDTHTHTQTQPHHTRHDCSFPYPLHTPQLTRTQHRTRVIWRVCALEVRSVLALSTCPTGYCRKINGIFMSARIEKAEFCIEIDKHTRATNVVGVGGAAAADDDVPHLRRMPSLRGIDI